MKTITLFVFTSLILTNFGYIDDILFEPTSNEVLGKESDSWLTKITTNIKNWAYDKVYGNKIEPEIFSDRQLFAQAEGSKRSVIIKLQKSNIEYLDDDFDFDYTTLFETTQSLYISALVQQSQITNTFWSELFNLGTSNTLADKSYIDWIRPNRRITLVEPTILSSLKEPTELGLTTYELCDSYKVLSQSYNGTGIRVAVLDTGVDLDHEGINNNTTIGVSFVSSESYEDKNGHGTHVIGILAGKEVNISGHKFRGIAPNATVYSIKVLDRQGSGTEEDIIEGIKYAIDQDCQIISMSLGGSIPYYSALHDAIQYAIGRGIVVVCASGNNGGLFSLQPASWEGCISVGSLTEDCNVAFYSNLYFDIACMGTNISSLKKGGGWITYSGTSMATPAVSGCIALLLDSNPELIGRPSQVVEYLTGTEDYVPTLEQDVTVWGLKHFDDFYLEGGQPNIRNLINLEDRTLDTTRDKMSYVWYQIHRS